MKTVMLVFGTSLEIIVNVLAMRMVKNNVEDAKKACL